MLHTKKGKKSEQHSTGQNCSADVKCQRRSQLVGRQSKFTVEISQRLIFIPPTPLLLKAADLLSTFSLLMSFNKAWSCPLCNCTFISNFNTEMFLTFTREHLKEGQGEPWIRLGQTVLKNPCAPFVFQRCLIFDAFVRPCDQGRFTLPYNQAAVCTCLGWMILELAADFPHNSPSLSANKFISDINTRWKQGLILSQEL